MMAPYDWNYSLNMKNLCVCVCPLVSIQRIKDGLSATEMDLTNEHFIANKPPIWDLVGIPFIVHVPTKYDATYAVISVLLIYRCHTKGPVPPG